VQLIAVDVDLLAVGVTALHGRVARFFAAIPKWPARACFAMMAVAVCAASRSRSGMSRF